MIKVKFILSSAHLWIYHAFNSQVMAAARTVFDSSPTPYPPRTAFMARAPVMLEQKA